MQIDIAPTSTECGRRAAAAGAERLGRALESQREATILLATGASQFAMLDALVAAPGLDWGRVTAFHLDEYVGLPDDHPASFRRYLRERFVARLPGAIGAFHFIDPGEDPAGECARLERLIGARTVDLAFIGIGENGHLAFNDPPADFTTRQAYHPVELDEDCRRQQLGEGWFAALDDVPRAAVSMTVPRILRSETIVCTVPEGRKAAAVRAALRGPVRELVPASALQRHGDCRLFLDAASAGAL